MKYRLFTVISLFMFFLAACKDGPILSSYQPVLPELPPHWKGILGEPHWRLEWIDENGIRKELEIAANRDTPGLTPIQEWSSPVLAWPFWPEWNLLPGIMRPAGAIFPWDIKSGAGKIILTWRGGVEAVFWKELAAAERTSQAAYGRLPWYFDWPRFRELLESGSIAETVRDDLWLADWKEIARKTVLSGFDRRRIVSKTFTEFSISNTGGRWIGSSPFAQPLESSPDGKLTLRVTDVPDSWVSTEGILKCSRAGYVFYSH